MKIKTQFLFLFNKKWTHKFDTHPIIVHHIFPSSFYLAKSMQIRNLESMVWYQEETKRIKHLNLNLGIQIHMCLPYYYCNEQTKTEAGDIEGHYSSFIVQNCVEKNANRSNKTEAKKLRLNKKVFFLWTQKICWKNFDFLHADVVAKKSLIIIITVAGGVVLETLVASSQDDGVGVVANVIVNGAVSSGWRLRA